MRQSRKLVLVANLILCFVLQTLGADKYTDENRPYEFGFKIDGQQHRHESKDENGIIMGEFGFVTADDVYHVTVYATDKEGRFKILSMKNIHLKSNSASGLGTPTSARQGHSLAQPAPPASVQISASPKQSGVSTQTRLGPFAPQASPVSQGPQHKPIFIEPPRGSCSSCSLPTTTTRAPPPAYNQVTNNNNYNNPNQIGAPGFAPQNQPVFLSTPVQQNNARPPSQQNYPSGQQNYPSVQQNVPQRKIVAPNSAFAPQPGQAVQNYPNSPNYSQEPGISNAPNNAQGRPGGLSNIPAGGQQIYASRPQNIPQGELVAPDGAQPFAPQSGQVPQNYPSSSSYSPKPGVFNAPNTYAQPERGAGKQPVLPPANPQNPRDQKALFGSNKNPYTGAGPSVPANTAPDGGNFNFGQNNAQPAELSGPNKPQLTGKSSNPPGEAGERTAKQYRPEQPFNSKLEPYGSQGPNTARGAQSGTTKPMLVTAQMQIVDKNTDIYALGPNEQRGLPPGLSQGDMTQLLYTFNYTVGFHGHFEEGYANGVKKGYYFVTGRNGVRTRIDYVADDTGFHPKVSQEVLDLLSDDVPKPETEKDEKYGLKGYEFKWLYYPVETK